MYLNKPILKVSLFFVVGLLLFFIIQGILCSKIYDNRMSSFYEKKLDSVEVVLLGTSHMECGISPIEMYETDSIKAYNLGTTLQSIETSYYLVKEFLTFNNPQVVVLDVSNLFMEDTDGYWWRAIMDWMPVSINKIKYISTYAKGEHNSTDGFINALIPFFEYHTRWNELSKNDFDRNNGNEEFLFGYNPLYLSVPAKLTVKQMNDEIFNSSYRANLTEYIDGMQNVVILEGDNNYNNEISENGIRYLSKIKDICNQLGIDLLLTKVPTMGSYEYNTSAWSIERYNNVKKICEEYDIDYWDLMYDAQSNIDWSIDSIDAGKHLNVRGAAKVSKCLADYLIENYNLSTDKDELYEKALEDYDRLIEKYYLMSESDLSVYLNRLQAYKDKYTILVAGSIELLKKTDLSVKDAFVSLGVQTDYFEYSQGGYVAYIQKGNIIYEGISDYKMKYNNFDSNYSIGLYATDYGYDTKVKIEFGSQKFDLEQAGILIVLCSEDTGDIIDKAWFVEEGELVRKFQFY